MSLVRVDTIKPITSSADLSLQGDSGGSAVDCLNITSAGDINFTGNTDAKIKLPSAGGIYESDGSTPVLTESGGVVSLGSAVVITGGAGKLLQTQYVSTDTAVSTAAGQWGLLLHTTYLTITKVAGSNIFLQWGTQWGKGNEGSYVTKTKIERATNIGFTENLVELDSVSGDTGSSTEQPGGGVGYTGFTGDKSQWSGNFGHTTIDVSLTATAGTYYYRVQYYVTGGSIQVGGGDGGGISTLYAMEIST